MRKINQYIFLFLLPAGVLSSESGQEKFQQGVEKFTQKITDIFLTPILILLVSLSVIYFVWGLVVFIRDAGEDAKREEARSHMVWGILGLFIIFSVWGIMSIIMATIKAVG